MHVVLVKYTCFSSANSGKEFVTIKQTEPVESNTTSRAANVLLFITPQLVPALPPRLKQGPAGTPSTTTGLNAVIRLLSQCRCAGNNPPRPYLVHEMVQ